MSLRPRFWLALPVALVYAADVALTFAGQPAEYWAGDRASAAEANPVGHVLLAAHPLVFLAFALAWAAAFTALLLWWRSRWAVVIAFLLAVGHTLAGAAWCVRLWGCWGIEAAALYLVVAYLFGAWCWRRSGLFGDGRVSPPTPGAS